jgi:uncharacterized protein (TIGR03083 family)
MRSWVEHRAPSPARNDPAVWKDAPMTAVPTIGERYLLAHASFAELARSLDDADWATPLPCTPAWSARDVLSHVAGIPDDAIAGRMEGAPGEAWTAAQVERNRSLTVDELLERWAAQAPGFADMLDQIGEGRPPLDCHSHEHDLRQALGRPGNRESVIIEAAAEGFAQLRGHEFAIEFDDGSMLGAGDGSVVLRSITRFDLFRSRLGRRSREQVRAWDWSGEHAAIESIVDDWFIFGPSPHPIEE